MGHDDRQDRVAQEFEPFIVLDTDPTLLLRRDLMGIGRMAQSLFEVFATREGVPECRFEPIERLAALPNLGHRMPSTIQPPPMTSSSLSAS